jgi:hypothetical protein
VGEGETLGKLEDGRNDESWGLCLNAFLGFAAPPTGPGGGRGGVGRRPAA